MFDSWSSNATDDLGSYTAWRIGATYFMEGFRANFKAGYEVFKVDEDFIGTTEDSLGTFVIGAYMNF
jgi:hypothetical protein